MPLFDKASSYTYEFHWIQKGYIGRMQNISMIKSSRENHALSPLNKNRKRKRILE